MRVGIPSEVFPEERRVAGTPRTVQRLVKAGFEVWVERDAGHAAGHSNGGYAEAGASVVDGPLPIWGECDIVLKVHPPQMHPTLGRHEADLLRSGCCLVGFIWPAQNGELLERLAATGASVIAMDCVPRISRAQPMDALSAMANVAGYRAVVEAVHHYPRFLAGQATAAGTIPPAKVLVIGAGVAGLASIGAARGLGAIVRAFDTRPEVAEQVESLGAEFVPLDFREEGGGEGGYAKQMSDAFLEAERALFAKQAMEVDIIISTALIPGREAPKLITAGMVESMREGSVIVDLAAQQGGNCTLTQPGHLVRHKSVSIVGFTDLPSRMALQSSWLYASTLANMLDEMGGAERFGVDMENEVVRGALVAHERNITWPPPKPKPSSQTLPPQPWRESGRPGAEAPAAESRPRAQAGRGLVWLGVAGLLLVAVGAWAPESFLRHLTVFVLACFVGWQVVWNVTPALHTPLMSVTNAISGIIIIGGMLHLSGGAIDAATVLGFGAVFVAAINIAGGFLVTRRMLAMFRK